MQVSNVLRHNDVTEQDRKSKLGLFEQTLYDRERKSVSFVKPFFFPVPPGLIKGEIKFLVQPISFKAVVAGKFLFKWQF